MFFQESTPDTSGYLIAGYAIAFLVMALYVASMYIRSRNLQQDMTILEDLEKSPPPVLATPKSEPKRRSSKSESRPSRKTVTKTASKK